jgi:uncharacterized coiled-coil protein SlyX
LAEALGKLYDRRAMTPKPKSVALAATWLALLAGCSSGLEGVDKRLSAMQEEITKVQSQNDRLVERLDAVEARQARSDTVARPAAAQAGGASERPSLKVVKVVPEDSAGMPTPQVGTQAPGDAADDPSPRPVIKLRGGGGKGDKSDKGES